MASDPPDLPDPPEPTDLRCPLCAAPLLASARAFACDAGHSFDRARQGYVNLLRPTRLRGDSAEMLRARRRFLQAGWYAPLAEALAQHVGAWLAADGAALPLVSRALLDLGCGEGYYLRRLAEELGEPLVAQGWRLCGLDLAKDAIRMAASGAPPAHIIPTTWVVASARARLPFADAGVGALLNIFAPRAAEEFARVVAPGGLLLVVAPRAKHLAEARAALPWLLSPQPDKDERLRATLEPAFALEEARPVSFTIALDVTALADLARMTPHRAIEPAALEAAVRAAIERAPDGRLSVRAACLVRRYRRRD